MTLFHGWDETFVKTTLSQKHHQIYLGWLLAQLETKFLLADDRERIAKLMSCERAGGVQMLAHSISVRTPGQSSAIIVPPKLLQRATATNIVAGLEKGCQQLAYP